MPAAVYTDGHKQDHPARPCHSQALPSVMTAMQCCGSVCPAGWTASACLCGKVALWSLKGLSAQALATCLAQSAIVLPHLCCRCL